MHLYSSLLLVFLLFALQTRSQTVQDDWTAPAAPDGSTPLQTGTKFTLLWKSGLQNSFETYCPECDTKKLDLWITNFNGTRYTSKIGRGIDVTSTSSYDWNVNIASDAFSARDFWVFRFTFFDSADPYTQQISSPGFRISGLVKATSTVAPRSSSTTTPAATFSSIAIISTSTPSTSITPSPTGSTSDPDLSPKDNTWIAGVVVGPLVGIAMGAALMWFCLRKRKNKKAQQDQVVDYVHHQQYSPDQSSKQGYSQAITSGTQPWQHQTGNHEYLVEAPGNTTPKEPAELWQGNYRS